MLKLKQKLKRQSKASSAARQNHHQQQQQQQSVGTALQPKEVAGSASPVQLQRLAPRTGVCTSQGRGQAEFVVRAGEVSPKEAFFDGPDGIKLPKWWDVNGRAAGASAGAVSGAGAGSESSGSSDDSDNDDDTKMNIGVDFKAWLNGNGL